MLSVCFNGDCLGDLYLGKWLQMIRENTTNKTQNRKFKKTLFNIFVEKKSKENKKKTRSNFNTLMFIYLYVCLFV